MRLCRAVLPSSGLANRLFPWARAKLFSARAGVPMLVPAWFQWKVGPMLRGEGDWRLYGGLFRKGEGEVGGLRRSLVLRTHRRVPEPRPGEEPPQEPRCLIEFAGMGDHFETLNGQSGTLRARLEGVVRERWLEAARRERVPALGIHVRRGDFAVPRGPEDLVLRGSVRTPIEWFTASLTCLRDRLRADLPAFVVSDGTDADLAPLLALPRVARRSTGSAIGDLLLLSRARAILGSGGSTFTAWAAFLAEAPVATVPGQSLAWYRLRHANGAYVGEFAPDAPAPGFLEGVGRAAGDPA